MLDPMPWLEVALTALRTPWGAVLFVPLYALWVTLLLPGVWASMLAGVLYGPWGGSFVVFLGASRLVLLTRLSPAFPFSLLNLAYGLSDVSLRDYSIGLIGIIPGTVLFCGLGALAGDVARFGAVLAGEADLKTWAMRAVGVIATLAVVWLVGRAAQQALAEGSEES
jgi:uncharacterized membrane protein YdjX (TVP38/TMEM64 family)